MKVTPLAIDGAWLIESPIHSDNRGMFREWFKSNIFGENGLPNFDIKQANTSVSSRGVIRGLHYSLAEIGQAKLVTCTAGSILDVVVDLRPNSKDYGSHVSVELFSNEGKSVFISSGLGHGFQALEELTVVTYLLDKEYSSNNEFGVNPLDKDLAVGWKPINPIVSEKDSKAPNFSNLTYSEPHR
jgi:dTDP-4-dehydrorhamnose 3,5-epimerase